MKLVFPLIGILFIQHSKAFSWEHVDGFSVSFVETGSSKNKITFKQGDNTVRLSLRSLVEIGGDRSTHVGTESSLKHTYDGFQYEKIIVSDVKHSNITTLVPNSLKRLDIPAASRNFTIEAGLTGPASQFQLEVEKYNFTYMNNSIRSGLWLKNGNSSEEYWLVNGTAVVNITLEDWKFCGVEWKCLTSDQKEERGEYLDLHISVYGLYNPPREMQDKARLLYPGYRRPRSYDLGSGDVTLSERCLIDNKWEEVESGYPKFVEEGNGYGKFIVRFPRFKKKLQYMIMISMYDERSTSDSQRRISNFSLLMFLTLVYLILNI